METSNIGPAVNSCEHQYQPMTRRGILPIRGLAGKHVCKRCGQIMRRIEPDMIVRNTINGERYRVRSVSRTKAVCQPLQKTKGWMGFEFEQRNLEIVRTRAQQK